MPQIAMCLESALGPEVLGRMCLGSHVFGNHKQHRNLDLHNHCGEQINKPPFVCPPSVVSKAS